MSMTTFNARLGKMLCLLILSCTALAGWGCDATNITENDFKPISLAEVRAAIGGKDASKTLLIDTRLPDKFDAGHLPGARNLQSSEARAKTGKTLNPELARYKTLIVYGENPASPTAKAMTQRLMILQHDDVRIFEGGWGEWVRAGLSSEKKEPAKAAEKTPSGS